MNTSYYMPIKNKANLHPHRLRIGQRIRELREGADMTQEQLGDAVGILRVNINRIERGKYNVTADTLHKIAEALGVEVDFVEV